MCEKDDLDEMYEISRSRDLSRRQFGALSLGVGLTALLPRLADGADTTESDGQIKPPGGPCAAFHGGGLATDKPESPHLLIPKMKAHFLIAIAENDDQREPEVKNILHDSFAKAHLPAEIEVYPGTKPGWGPPDSAVYNAEQAEKAWGRMMVLFKTALA